jgi:hypothetical protein
LAAERAHSGGDRWRPDPGFRVEFLGENEGLRVGMSTWEKIDLVDEVERSLREVYDDLKMEMRVGIITR